LHDISQPLLFTDSKDAYVPDSFEQILASIAAKPKYLPEWPDGQRAMPNEILRSALFNCRNRNVSRVFMKEVEIAVIGDGQVIYRGEELRQDDELVWMHLMHLTKKTHWGNVSSLPLTHSSRPLAGPLRDRTTKGFGYVSAACKPRRCVSSRSGCKVSSVFR